MTDFTLAGQRIAVAAALLSAVARIAGRREAVRKSDEPTVSTVGIGIRSPQLLRDVGFEASAGPGGCVWRSGAYRTGVSRRDAGVQLLREARF